MEKWYQFLYYTENIAVNIERVATVKDITGRETLEFVLRTLDILGETPDTGAGGRAGLTEKEYEIVKTVLQWSEVAKGGTAKDRADWKSAGYPLDIHNIASAEIYRDNVEDASEVIYTLIKTHGMIGQCLRGEVPAAGNAPLTELYSRAEDGCETAQAGDALDVESLRRILYVLNECIIAGVSETLWDRVGSSAKELIDRILEGDYTELESAERVRRLLPGLSDIPEELTQIFSERFFPRFELWYFEAALSDFFAEQVTTILKVLDKKLGSSSPVYISFKPLSDSLYYDYEGKKHINVYKKRIIEKYLRDIKDIPELDTDKDGMENVTLSVDYSGGAALVNFKFSPVCEKLIEFCVEAERSGLLTFEKSITVLYDMFGFRRDEFDRLNNEDKYLETMNSSEESTKNTIIDYVVGKTVVDVGSGGGVLLDLLEKTYPDKRIIGTDISENVIDVLNKKRASENHNWTVERHNFAEAPFLLDGKKGKLDTVIFSSIIHEIYSYTETPEGRFNIEVVKQALKYAYDSLRPNGRIVIRDGVKTPIVPGKDTLQVTFKDRSGLEFFKNYVKDFQGLPDIEDKRITIDEKALRVSACTNFIREFLYTYTWGQESYSHEVQEQFGYFTIDEYKDFFRSLGARIIRADSFLEPGYPEHLRPLVSLEPDVFPDSNCIVVVEKPLLIA